MAKEAQIQGKILQWLESEGIFAYKVIASNKRGIPDIAVVFNGRAYFLEVKGRYGKTTEIQDYQIQRIANAGGIAVVVRSLEDAKRVFATTIATKS